MRLTREFPANPHAVVFHAEQRLTDRIVETFFPDQPQRPPGPVWATSLLEVPGVRVLSINAYKIRVQKVREIGWCRLLPNLERVLHDELTVGETITDLREKECRKRAFAWHGPDLDREVFEGRDAARHNLIARPLFELPGVAEVVLDGHCVEVRKCPLYTWEQLAGAVETVIEQARAASL